MTAGGLDGQLFLAAAFAPAVVWLLWRGQTLSVELLRVRMLVLTRHRDQKWIYSIVSWFGTLLHELSHATVLLLSGHGISRFRAGVEEGHVLPSRMRTGGLGMLSFLVAALAPLFIPPLLVLLALLFLVDRSLLVFPAAGPGLQPALEGLRQVLLDYPVRLLSAMGNLDLARAPHLAVFLLILLGIPGSRPSHVKGSRFHGTGDEGDVAALRAHIRRHPLPFAAFLLLLYAAYFLVLVLPAAYWIPMGGLWALALTGIVLALFGSLWWSFAGLDGRVTPLLAWAGFAAFIAVQVGARLAPSPMALSVLQANLLSLAAWLAVSLLLGLVLPRRR